MFFLCHQALAQYICMATQADSGATVCMVLKEGCEFTDMATGILQRVVIHPCLSSRLQH